MTVERIPIDPKKDRAAWLELRRRDVTASDVAAVCGVSPWKTALRVYLEKTGEVPEDSDSNLMRRGLWYEPAVIEAALYSTDWLSLTPARVYLRDPALRLGATPDAVGTDAEGQFIVQLKVVERIAFETWDGPPLPYQLQTLTEAMLWGAPRAFLAVLINEPFGAEFISYPIPRNPGAEARIRRDVARFWEDVAAGRAPSADYSRDGDSLRALYPPRPDVPVADLRGDNYMTTLLDERAGLKAAVKTAEARLDAIDAEIVEKLAGAEAATCDGWRISHKIVDRAAYTVPARSFPQLRITKPKGP